MDLRNFLKKRPGLIQELNECINDDQIKQTLKEIVTAKDAKVLDTGISNNDMKFVSGGAQEIGAMFGGNLREQFHSDEALGAKICTEFEKYKNSI